MQIDGLEDETDAPRGVTQSAIPEYTSYLTTEPSNGQILQAQVKHTLLAGRSLQHPHIATSK